MTPRFFENIHLNIPKPITINHDEFGKTECSVINKVLIRQVEEIEDKLLESIRDMAIANGIDDVFVIDKKAVLSALKKQILKKPINRKGTTYFYCPFCGGNRLNNYCADCGQALDWSDSE